MNPFYLLLPEDKPALSDKNTTITYKELIPEAVKIRDWMMSQGYKYGHRIGIAGSQSVDTYKYILAAQMLSSAVGLRCDYKDDWDWKTKASNLNVILELDEDVKVHHKHFDKSTFCTKEFLVFFSSGTTSSNYGIPRTTPMCWEIDEDNWGQSLEVNHYCRALVNEYVHSPEKNIQIQPMQYWIPWAQELVTCNLVKQGHTIIVDKADEWDPLVEKFQPTWTSMFPSVALRLRDNNLGMPGLKCVEFSGARVTMKQVELLKDFFKCDYFTSHYGTSQAGNLTATSGDGSNLQHFGKPCPGFVHAFGEDIVRIGKNGTMECKWPANPPTEMDEEGYWDTNDICTIGNDGNYQFLGRKDEMILIFKGGGKFHAPTVENILLEHEQLEEVYIYPIQDPEEVECGVHFQEPGCLYLGDLSVDEVYDYCLNRLPPYQRPIEIHKLRSSFEDFMPERIWKVRRNSMNDWIQEKHDEWCSDSYYQ